MHASLSRTGTHLNKCSHLIYAKVCCALYILALEIIGRDLEKSLLFFGSLAEFADLGHKLFRTTQETYPIAFVPGDIFDPKHLEVVLPVASASAAHERTTTGDDPPSVPTPDLRSLTSLNPLHGRVFAIYASSFFHMFGEEKQLHVARALAGLLSPEPGSVIFGLQVGLPEKGFDPSVVHWHRDHRMWCHSPESWTELWDGLVFENGMVNVQTKLVQMGKKNSELDAQQNTTFSVLVWSVTRL
ncbi:hypothetical protein BGY98DRAFT_946070 [Russula aff. rugulosa BPL654]|nr:hypothetical protein BGY98DRAFT_946070 [Russula aff. rugulosa BPL654]